MFKRSKISIIIFIALAIVSCSSNQNDNSEPLQGLPFTFSADRRGRAITSTVLNDSIPVKLIFDTGSIPSLILKSSLVKKLYNEERIEENIIIKSGHNNGFYTLTAINDSIFVSIAENTAAFPQYYSVDDNSPLGEIIGDFDGILPIPNNIHDLTISFSEKKIAINAYNRLEKHDFCSPIYRTRGGGYAFEKFPFMISNKTILCDSLIIDTGYRGDIIHNGIISDENLLKSLKDNNILQIELKKRSSKLYYMHDELYLKRDFWVQHIYDKEDLYASHNNVAGVEFLKSFDIYIDFEADSVWLKRIKHTKLLDEDTSISGPVIAGLTDTDKTFSVLYLKSNSIYDSIGIKPGDIIISVNNKSFNEYRDSIRDRTFCGPLGFYIKRQDTTLNISLMPKKTNNYVVF